MKKFLLLIGFVSALFSYDVVIQEKILECSNMKLDSSRLACFDRLSKAISPNSKDNLRAKVLTQECYACHGERWDVPTKYGSRAVRHMKKDSIEKSLLMYKEDDHASAIMRNIMKNKTKKEIELMSLHIVNSIKE